MRNGSDRRIRQMGTWGFTLIELLVTLAVAAIALTLGVPAFTHMVASNRLATASNSLVDALNAARSQAVRGNQDTAFCSNSTGANTSDTLGSACGNAAGAVYALVDAASVAVRAAPTLASSIQLSNGTNGAAVAAVRFGGDGLGHAVDSTMPYTGLVADVYSTQVTGDNHRCIYMTTGSVVSTCPASSTCPADEPKSCQ